MRSLFVLAVVGCHSPASPAPAPSLPVPIAPAADKPSPAVRPETQDLVDRLDGHEPFDDEELGVQRAKTTRDWLGATIGEGFYAFARLDGHWVATPAALARDGRFTLERVFDASSLTQPAMGYVISSYDGGSETGVERTALYVVCADTRALRPCGAIDLGHFVWALGAEHRREFPGAATSLNARPHVEVRLEPTFVAPDRIRLAIAVDGSTLPAPDDDTLAELARIRANVGTWRLTGRDLVR